MATPPPDSNGASPVHSTTWAVDPGEASAMHVAAARAELTQRLYQHLLSIVSSSRDQRLDREKLRLQLARAAETLLHDDPDSFDFTAQQSLLDEVLDHVLGYGPIGELMRDQEITDILVNGPRQVFFEKSGQLHKANVAFQDENQLLEVVNRMLAGSGRTLDEQCRMIDARLPDGSRLNVVSKPPALNGPLVSIRRFGARPLTAADLIVNESLMPEMLEFLSACVKARMNIVISGSAGSGKTTLLNALSRFIPESERVVTIEDTAELELQQQHVAKMESIAAAPGVVSLRELVHNALRMRPDRIIVGECRGPEALDMLQAMSTGHEGSMTTIHGNSPREVLARIELMIGMAGYDMPAWLIRKLIVGSINIVVQVARVPGGRRRVMAISEIAGLEGDVICMHELFEFVQKGSNGQADHFRVTGNRPGCLQKLQVRGTGMTPQLFAARVLGARKT